MVSVFIRGCEKVVVGTHLRFRYPRAVHGALMPRELRQIGGYSPSTRAANDDVGGDSLDRDEVVVRCCGGVGGDGVRKLLR